MFAPPSSLGLRRNANLSRVDASATMTTPSPYVSSECSMRPPSPSTLRRTSKPNALQSQSIAFAASS